MRKIIGLIFAAGRVAELGVLTERRPKSAVIFGGSYRIIDFAMTNLVESGIEIIGIITQYRPSSLIEHIAGGVPWDLYGRTRIAKILSPYQYTGNIDWYRGTADALYQNIDFIERYKPENVLIVSGDHIYRMDYRPLMQLHDETNAELTMAFTPVKEGASRFGIGKIDADGRVVDYEEKPLSPRANLASMTVYLFKREILLEWLHLSARNGRPSAFARTSTPWDRDSLQPSKTFQIYDEIIPAVVKRGGAYGKIHNGYWEYCRTIDSYYRAHQDLLSDPPLLDLENWGIRTNTLSGRVADPSPTRYGKDAKVSMSLISAGCTIRGVVEGSVLSPDVVVETGAVVRNSILWHSTRVGAGALVDHVITDKFVTIGDGAKVGIGEVDFPNAELPHSLSCGVTVIGREARIPSGARIGRNCIIHPMVMEKDFINGTLKTGDSLRPSLMGR